MSGPLHGLRVLDLSRYVAGPFCALLLADLGAEVVKVERPGGEESRTLPPRFGDLSTYFMVYNRNKKGITLNLRHPRGPDLLRRLAGCADILVENFRPGVLAALGCDPADLLRLHPGLIVVSVSGYGQDGPESHLPAFDAIAQALGGLMALTGGPGGSPQLAGTFVGDYTAGLYAALGAAAAVAERTRTGRGRHVDVALVDSVASLLMTAVPDYVLEGRVMGPAGTHDRYRSPANSYAARDGSVYLIAATPSQFEALAQALAMPELLEDARFRDPDSRVDHREELDRLIAAWVRERTVGEVVRHLGAWGVPCAPVRTVTEVATDERLRSRGQILWVDHPPVGPVPLPGCPVRFRGGAARPSLPAPHVGEHNADIYGGWLGLSADAVAALRREEVL